MTTPIAPSAIPQFGTPPSTQDPANFDVRMDDTLSKLVVFVDATNATADDTYQNAQSAFENATASASDVVLTAASKVTAEAALADTVIAKDLAEAAATAANLSSVSATAAKDLAEAAADQVDVAGALAGLPPRAGNELKAVRVNGSGTALEYFALPAVERLHVLSAAAATKNAVTAMLPMFDSSHSIPNASGATDRMMYTGSLFLTGPTRGSPEFYATSPDGKTFTERYLGFGINFNLARNNGANVIVFTGSAAKRSSDSGISFTGGASLGRIPTFTAYATSGTYLAGDAALCQVSTNNAVSFTADQTIPASASNVFAVGTTFVSYNIASGTYYTSTTGLTGSWTARTLPDAITASKIWEDGAGGLVLVSTTTSKNLWHTVDGIAWTDLGFSQDSLKYGGLSDATNNTAAFVCPVRINGNWVLLNGATAGAGGAGAMVKYAGNTWVPMFVDVGGIANTDPSKMLVATNGAGVTVIRDASVNDKVRLINTASTKCVGNFI